MEEPHGLHRPFVERLEEALLLGVLLVDDFVLDALDLFDLAHCEQRLDVFELLSGGVDLEDLDVFLLRLPLLGKLKLGDVHMLERHVDQLLAAVGRAFVECAHLHHLRGEVADQLSLFVILNGGLDVLDVGPVDGGEVLEAHLLCDDAACQHLGDVSPRCVEGLKCIFVVAVLDFCDLAVVEGLDLILVDSCLDDHIFLAERPLVAGEQVDLLARAEVDFVYAQRKCAGFVGASDAVDDFGCFERRHFVLDAFDGELN